METFKKSPAKKRSTNAKDQQWARLDLRKIRNAKADAHMPKCNALVKAAFEATCHAPVEVGKNAIGPTMTGFICKCSCRSTAQAQTAALTTIGPIVVHIENSGKSPKNPQSYHW